MMDKSKTAEYQVIPDADGSRYSFFCGVTGARFCTERAYRADSPGQELLLAWENEGRRHFNLCRRCGKWVVDVAYNPEVLECVECAAFEDEARFCKTCGARVPARARICPACGASLYYEGVGDI